MPRLSGMVTLVGPASYQIGSRIFLKGQPQEVEGEELKFYQASQEFSVIVNEVPAPRKEVAVVQEVEPEEDPITDDELPEPESDELPTPVVAKTGKKKKVVRK